MGKRCLFLFPHFAVGGAVVGSVADLHLSQGVFGGLAVDEQGEVGPFACPVAISAQRLAIKAIFAVQVGGGYGCDFAVLDLIERSSAGFRKIGGQLFGEMKRALSFATTHGVRLADAVAKSHGDMESYESRYRFKHVASRTVLSKGLELDIAIVDATTVTDPRDFYVAVSRCRLGLIVIANSRTLHFDGISR